MSRYSINVVDITPGRKIHAIALLLGAMEVGARVRYAYLVSEARYGYRYRYFGYAPFSGIRVFEIEKGFQIREVGLSIPRVFKEGEATWLRTSPEVLHSFINEARIVAQRIVLEGCFSRVELSDSGDVLLVESISQSYARPRLCRSCSLDDVARCLESVSPVPNLEDAVARIRRCVEDDCTAVFDTNAVMRGLITRLGTEVRQLYRAIHILETVARELLDCLEQKHGSEGVKKLLGFIELAKRGLVIAAPPDPRDDRALLIELQKFRTERRCLCFVTADRGLCLASKNLVRRRYA